MPMEHTISSWAAIDWMGEMSWEKLLATTILQLERRPEGIERTKAKLQAVRKKNKD